ncbi:DDHD-domain-containing protein [Hesseltinella vesiculosa]|uniref:DDHD-domain-containing protein n=1 Tax=Hesseltinella vesiculosa TaxID=101127 RepID=A0A1X2G7B2_9FUNG|nr:DDHD-domain-containing protein [Hesseltinella vesiculosa]
MGDVEDQSRNGIIRSPANLDRFINDPQAPGLSVRWFHATDQPLAVSNTVSRTNSSKTSKSKAPAVWTPFSNQDSLALEKAFLSNETKVNVAEDMLFEVQLDKRIIYPVYWNGPSYMVRRATWFVQVDGSTWLPCEENLAEQIEIGYHKHKPYKVMLASADALKQPTNKRYSYPQAKIDDLTSSPITMEEKKLELSLSSQSMDRQWNLLGRFLGQYVVYTGEYTAWLLSKQNLGGMRLIRGYENMEKQKAKSAKPSSAQARSTPTTSTSTSEDEQECEDKLEEDNQLEQDEEIRKIDHLVFTIHGIGQKMTNKTGHSFVDDMNIFRKTVKQVYNEIYAKDTPNGILLLPIIWRHDIKFGVASDGDKTLEADLGMLGTDDGCPTLENLTLEGIPNIRTLVSDVLMDIPLYMTPKYHDQMVRVITDEMNRVFKLYTERNPNFGGKVSVIGYSLGSMLAYDILSSQPFLPRTIHLSEKKRKVPPLDFKVQNFFAVGSPLGVIHLLKGLKISSRKLLKDPSVLKYLDETSSHPHAHVSTSYPAVENMYNIFHKADPVAYRLEPLVNPAFAKLKPAEVPYVKGGLKGVFEAGYSFANRAGAMYESLKVGLTTSLVMRGLGLSKYQLYESTTPSNNGSDNESEVGDDTQDYQMSNNDDEYTKAIRKHQIPNATTGNKGLAPLYPFPSLDEDSFNYTPSANRIRSNSDPAQVFSSSSRISSALQRPPPGTKPPKPHTRHSPTTPLRQEMHDDLVDRSLKMLNMHGRVDFALQEGLLENPYLNVVNAHMSYWQDIDVAAFIIREIYDQT